MIACSPQDKGTSSAEKNKDVSRDEAIEVLNNGEVKKVMQTHDKEVYLYREDGTRLHTKDPKIGDIFSEVDKCGEACNDIQLITE